MTRLFLIIMFLASGAAALDMPEIDATVEMRRFDGDAPVFGASLFANNLEWVHGGNGLLDENGEWDRSLLEAAKELAPPLIRFPGGKLASTYQWEGGIGPSGAREDGLDFNGARQKMRFGTDDYLELLSRLGARGMITVNLKKDPAENAAWLRYIMERKGRYNPQPDVPLWEIGNESYITMDPSFASAKEYVELYEAHHRHLKAVDSSVQVGAILDANTLGLPWVKPIIPENDTWNDSVIGSLHKKGIPPDFYAIHLYGLFDSDPDDGKNRQALLVVPAVLENKIRLLRETLAKYGDSAPLHVTEFSIVMKEPLSTWKYSLDPVQGTYVMDMIMMFARNGIQAAFFWSMLNSYNFGAYGNDSDYLFATGRMGSGAPGYRPAGKLFLALRQYRGREMYRTEVKAPNVAFAPVGIATANDSASMVNAIALRPESSDEETLVLAVNRSTKDTVRLSSVLEGKRLIPARINRVSGDGTAHPAPSIDDTGESVLLPPMCGAVIAYEPLQMD